LSLCGLGGFSLKSLLLIVVSLGFVYQGASLLLLPFFVLGPFFQINHFSLDTLVSRFILSDLLDRLFPELCIELLDECLEKFLIGVVISLSRWW